jgi:hypothetical protein
VGYKAECRPDGVGGQRSSVWYRFKQPGLDNAALRAGGNHVVPYQQPHGNYYSIAPESSRGSYVTFPETPRSNSSPFMDDAHGAFISSDN